MSPHLAASAGSERVGHRRSAAPVTALAALLLLGCAPLAAAEPSVLMAAQAARAQAEAQLEAERSAILAARRQAAAALQAATSAVDEARRGQAAAQEAQRLARARADEQRLQRERHDTQQRHHLDQTLRTAGVAGLGNDETLAAGQARLELALGTWDARCAALSHALLPQSSRAPVVLRDGRIALLPILDLGARAAACDTDPAGRGILVPLAPASSAAAWRLADALPPPAAQGIPLDVDGSLAVRRLSEPRSAWAAFCAWLAAGRLFIWPILGVLLAGLVLAASRCWALARMPVARARLDAVLERLRRAGPVAASRDLNERAPLDRVLAAGLRAHDRGHAEREAALDEALLAETGRLQAGLPLLLVLAGIAPLLGLLGTVTGMIDLFAVIAAQGSGNAKALSGGISEALITAQAGMIAAIPLLVLHALLARSSERRVLRLEEAACALLAAEQQRAAAQAAELQP